MPGRSPALDGLISALAELRAEAVARNRTNPDGQLASNEVAWCTARVEAASACLDWAERSGNSLATMIADAAIDEARERLIGATAAERIVAQERLSAIAEAYHPLADLGDSEDHRMLRTVSRDFAENEIRPHAGAIHRGDLDLPESIIRGVSQLGLFGISIPSEYGGTRGATPDYKSMLIVTEELSKASLTAGGSLITRPEILISSLLSGGTDEQKRHWLPAIAAGERLVAVAVTEPDFGSDVASLNCRAKRANGGWQINGTKLWCTFAGRAELLMLLCRTSDAGHRGLSLFVVEKPPYVGHSFEVQQAGGGSLRGRSISTIGYRGMHTFELTFDAFELPNDSLVGGDEGLNRGFYLQMHGFAIGRLQTAARAVGVMEASLEETLAYTAHRRVFGRSLNKHELAASMLGRMAVHSCTARQLGYRAAQQLSNGAGQMTASLAKLYGSRVAESVTRDGMQLHGGMGYAEETNASRYFVDARVLTIFEGAEEILSLRVIAKALLDA